MAVRDRPLCRSIKLNKVQNSMKKLIINDLYTKKIKFNNNAGSSWKTWNQDQTGRFANRIFAYIKFLMSVMHMVPEPVFSMGFVLTLVTLIFAIFSIMFILYMSLQVAK